MLEVFYGFKIKSPIEEREFVIYLKSRHCIDLKSHSQASSPRRDSCNVSKTASQPQILYNYENVIAKEKGQNN